jgi:DNA-binding MarR family transcriptional regulator
VSPELRLSLLLRLVAAHQRMAQLVQRELAADGVDDDGYAMLSLIGVRGPVRLTELAAELGLPLTTASDVVRRLETRGDVHRMPNPGDGRSSLFALTPAGELVWRQGFDALRRVNVALDQELADGDAVRSALDQLDAAFERALGKSPT